MFTIKKIFFCFLVLVLMLGLFWASPAPEAYAQGNKRIEVNLSGQRLQAFEGNTLVFDFPISSGKPWWPTPPGTYYPWIKLRFDRMRGGSISNHTYYDLPNVPYVVYFYQGYALHGTYWHNNFGHPMSHGCVNLRTGDMAKLYSWIEMSTPIIIYGTTPRA